MTENETFRICHSLGFNMVATAFSFHEHRLRWLKENRPELFEHAASAIQKLKRERDAFIWSDVAECNGRD